MTPILAAILLFLAAQFAIGVWVSRRIATEEDYLVAGRRLGYPLAILSIFATWFGAETVIGSAGKAVSEGVGIGSAEPFGYGLCLILMGALFAAPLWRRKLTTLADLFRERYSIRVERLAALILIPSSILWAAAQIRAFGQVLAHASTLDATFATVVAAGVAIGYTAFGGLLVDAITDMIQGGILVIGLVALLVVVVHALGGVEATATAVAHSERLHWSASSADSVLGTIEAWAIPVFGSVVATELVARVIATRTPTVAARSSLAAGALYLTVGLIPVVVGLVATEIVPIPVDPEQFLPEVGAALLPTALYVLFAGGLISVILSTVDSTLLVSSGLLSHNLLVPAFGIQDERIKVRLARWIVVTFGALSLLLALRAEGVFALVEEASAFGSAGTLVAVVFGLFTRFGGPITAGATMIAGMVAYLGATALTTPHPFLTSLAAAVMTYLIGGSLALRPGRNPSRLPAV